MFEKIKSFFIGKAKDIQDPRLFHNLSLVAFVAWVGLGSDGLSSSCYGPEEAFLALHSHMFLGIFVALATVFTIFIVSSSYCQIIELFPAGGGGYLVASKLLSPFWGMISGCALILDYVLTITISIACGADALFSFLPADWYFFKLECAIGVVLILMILNMRGVKESVVPLIPIFLIFIITHLIMIIFSGIIHISEFGGLAAATVADVSKARAEVGLWGILFLIMRSYSMGAGTYTGIEAVSNGMSILREPRVNTAKHTMRYMAGSLAFLVIGLMVGYLLYRLEYQHGKTLNAVLFEAITKNWNQPFGRHFVIITLFSEAILLFVAAQTGFLGGPRVLANMAKDRWFPSQFALLSERFVSQNGVLLMGTAALLLMIVSRGSVKFLVVLYSINVFITFFLSHLGLVKHWWQERILAKSWKRKMMVSGIGLILTAFILVSMVVIKFKEGGWITLFITGSLMILALFIKRHYRQTLVQLRRLNSLLNVADITTNEGGGKHALTCNVQAKTAVILVNGYNGLGLHTLFNVIRLFGDNFKNFVFVQVGIVDSGNFKGVQEIDKLQQFVNQELHRYTAFMTAQGFYSEAYSAIGTEVIDETADIAKQIMEKYPKAVFFGGQMVFPKETFFSRVLHNYTTFAVQRKLYQQGVPFIIMPIRVDAAK